MTDLLNVYPAPKKLTMYIGKTKLSNRITVQQNVQIDDELSRVNFIKRMENLLQHSENNQAVLNLHLNKYNGLHEEGYVIQLNDKGLTIDFSTVKGLHYALITLEQIVFRNGYELNYFRIEDEPAFPVRGFMLDIGRNKIPKMKTLYALIDQMAKLKLNHLQFHMEGYAFQYKKYAHLFPNSTPITAKEFQLLADYAEKYFIDLVPNQNSFGHMAEWLNKPELKHLAEHPNGLETPFNFTLPPFTLNPLDEESLALVANLFNELIPNFNSNYVNINFDEPFGLGKGQSKDRAKEIGVGNLYMEFAEKVFNVIRKHNKKILMWGDILTSHPETISQLPKDVTVLDWNYEASVSFEKNAAYFAENNVPFYVCCGTSSWSSISGRIDNMLQNVTDAAVNGNKYGAKGLIITDWGDNGHWQVLPISYPGMVYAAGVSWQVDANLLNEGSVEAYLSDVVFQDKRGVIGNLLLELGRYYHFENSSIENATYTNQLLISGLTTKEAFAKKMNAMIDIFNQLGGNNEQFRLNYDFAGIKEWIALRKEQVESLDLQIADAEIVVDELNNTIRLIEQGIGLHQFVYEVNIKEEEKLLHVYKLREMLKKIMEEFERLWLIRNRAGGLAKSVEAFDKLLKQYDEKLKELQIIR